MHYAETIETVKEGTMQVLMHRKALRPLLQSVEMERSI